MNSKIILFSALRSLRKHKVRSILTTLGIIIGVIAIICVMSIGEGAKHKVTQEIDKLGSNFVIALSASQKKLSQRVGSSEKTPIFTKDDIKAIMTESENIAAISPGFLKGARAVYGNRSWSTQVAGAASNYTQIREWDIVRGSFYTQADVRSKSKVAVIGQTVHKELFGDQDPIGEVIRIKRIPFKIIGVLGEKGKRPDGNDEDDVIFIPITTAMRRIKGGKERYFALIMSATEKEKMSYATEEVRGILRQQHRIREGQEEDFTVFSQDDMHQASDAASKVLNLLLLFVASISLIVGGIGIMNIMLVTVTERTREIGIRMALGATTQNILFQFVLEAITICLVGGLIGVGLGSGASKLIGIALGWPISVPTMAIVVSLGSCVFIGLFFGFYPAYKASRLNPVEALIER